MGPDPHAARTTGTTGRASGTPGNPWEIFVAIP